MIRIDKEEAMMIRELFGEGACIYRTCKQKSKRHHYLLSEEDYNLRAIADMRGGMTPDAIRKKYRNTRTYSWKG